MREKKRGHLQEMIQRERRKGDGNIERDREICAIIIVMLNSDASSTDLVDLREKKRLKVQCNGNINATISVLDINRKISVERICLPGIFHEISITTR